MIINKKNQTELSGLYFIYEGSTNLEKKGWFGISHFLEHIKCKCYDDMMDELQENGISYNAYTSANRVVFYFTGLEEYLAPLRGRLIARMYKPLEEYVTIEDLEKEKTIVLEEYQDTFTDQSSTFYQNYFRRKYNYASPIGLKEDIENYTYEDCLEFYDLQYKNPDTIINISKDFELEALLNFDDRTDKFIKNLEPNPNASIESRGEFLENDCVIYDQTVDEEDLVNVKIINSILGSGLNSPLYQEIREKRALCYGVSAFTYSIGNVHLLMFNTNTSPKNLDEIGSTLKMILDDPQKYLTVERLELIRKEKMIGMKKSLINRHANISDITESSVSDLYDIIETVQLDDLNETYEKYYSLYKFERTTDKDLV